MTSGTPHRIPIQLTPEQREQIRVATGLDAELIAFDTHARVLRCVFGGLSLEVSRGVFPPQPPSEKLARAALELAADQADPVLVEVGTGCGAVALLLASERPDAKIHATDLSAAAVRCARRNRRRLELRNVRYHVGSLAEPLPARLRGKVAVLVANLPSVVEDPSSSLEWWPEGTAIGLGRDGLDLLRELARQAIDLLRPGGWLVVQLGDFQWEGLASELVAMGYLTPDPTGGQRHRAVIGRAQWMGARRSAAVP